MPNKKQNKAAKKRRRQTEAKRIQRPEGDKLEQLRKQIRFISKSAKEYDSGDADEAANIANHISMVVHDSGMSKSILTQLGKKDISFYDSAFPRDPRDVGSYQGLVVMEMSSNPKWGWVPLVFGGDGPSESWKSFDEWWNATVLDDRDGIEFTRRDIVLAVRDRDGGAHIDPELDESYVKMEKLKEFAFKFSVGGQEVKPRVGAGLASVRQIAFEVLTTLGKEFPAFLRGKYVRPEPKAVTGPNTTLVGGLQLIEIDDPDSVPDLTPKNSANT